MSIRRAPRPRENFTVIDNRIINDERIGWAAQGLLIYLLSKPDDWKVSAPALVAQKASAATKTGRDGIYALLNELKDFGYARHETTRDASGKVLGCDWVIGEGVNGGADQQLPPSPHPAQPETARPDALLSTERLPRTEDTKTPSGFVELPFDASLPAAKKPAGADLNKCVEAWNAICGKKLPPIRGLGGERKKQLPARLAELTDDPTQQFAEWVKLCKRIARSPHMTGDNNHGWIGTFDFVMKPANLQKILEGNYDNRNPGMQPNPGRFTPSPGTI